MRRSQSGSSPTAALTDIRKTDLIFIPSTGISVDDVVERNAAVVPWLRRWHKRGTPIASVCSGVGLVAATGLLDGKRATTHWGLAEQFRQKYPRVKWMPELMVTEDRGFYCGGGVNASLDLSLYLVERFCGHEVAMQSAKALLIETPRAPGRRDSLSSHSRPSIPTTAFPARRIGCTRIFTRPSRLKRLRGEWA